MNKLLLITSMLMVTTNAVPAQEKLPPAPRDAEGMFVMDGPFHSEIAGFWGADSKAVIDRDAKNNVKINAQARITDAAGNQNLKQISVSFKTNESCFDNLIPRRISFKEKLVVIESPACGGNGMPEQYYLIDFATGKVEKQNSLQAQKNGLSLKPLYYPEIAKVKSNSDQGVLDFDVKNGDVVAAVFPDDTAKFFTNNESRILTKDYFGNQVIIKGRFTGKKANGRWVGNADGLQVIITTKLTGNDEGMPNGVADFEKNGEKTKVIWSMPDSAIQF